MPLYSKSDDVDDDCLFYNDVGAQLNRYENPRASSKGICGVDKQKHQVESEFTTNLLALRQRVLVILFNIFHFK